MALSLSGAREGLAQTDATPAPTTGAAPPADQGPQAQATQASATKREPEPLPWRGTTLSWDHEASAQTVGVGSDYQSHNAYYNWIFMLSPRYYVVDGERWKSSIRGELGLVYEFTNADSTTRRGELDTAAGTAADWIVSLHHEALLYESGGYSTRLGLIAPELIPPTSRASRANGTIGRLGVGVFPTQTVPVLGPDSHFFREFTLGLRGRYRYLFTTATEPVNDEIDRERTNTNGSAVFSDQLGGANFPQHQVRLGVNGLLHTFDSVTLVSRFEWWMSWLYPVSDSVEICNLPTGCVTPGGVENPRSLSVTTLFILGADIDASEYFDLGLLYITNGTQLGADGQRRGMLYNLDSVFIAEISLELDSIYTAATQSRTESAHSGTTNLASAFGSTLGGL
jgi:hypothetical protein